MALYAAACLLFVLLLAKQKRIRIQFFRLYLKYYAFYFYTAAIAFGVSHLGFFQIGNFIPLLPVVLILTFIFGGLMLGYVRVKMGLLWSIAFHALHNLIFVGMVFVK